MILLKPFENRCRIRTCQSSDHFAGFHNLEGRKPPDVTEGWCVFVDSGVADIERYGLCRSGSLNGSLVQPVTGGAPARREQNEPSWLITLAKPELFVGLLLVKLNGVHVSSQPENPRRS